MLRWIVVGCAVSLLVGGIAEAQLVTTNLNFNMPPGGNSTTLAPSNSTGLTGWTVDSISEIPTTAGIEFGTTFGTPGLSSTQSLLLGTSNSSTYHEGGVQQTITGTIPGQYYAFNIEAKNRNGISSTAGTISFGGQTLKISAPSKVNWTFTSGCAPCNLVQHAPRHHRLQ